MSRLSRASFPNLSLALSQANDFWQGGRVGVVSETISTRNFILLHVHIYGLWKQINYFGAMLTELSISGLYQPVVLYWRWYIGYKNAIFSAQK